MFTVALALSCVTVAVLAAYPMAGIVLLFISKPIIDATWGQPVVADLPLTQVVSGLVPIVIFARMVIARPEEQFRHMPLRGVWATYAMFIGFCSSIALFHEGWSSGANVFFRHINGFVGFYMIQAYFHQQGRLKVLLLGLIVAGFFPIGTGLYQLATGTTWRFQEVEGIARNIGLYHNGVTIRLYALQSILAALLYGVLYAKSGIVKQAAVWAYMAMAAAVLAKAYSKAGILIITLWISSWTLLQRKFAAFAVILGLVFILGVSLAAAYFESIVQIYHKELGFFSGREEAFRTFNGRWYGWEEMYTRWMHFDVFAKAFGSGQLTLGAHNDYLQMLFHGGIVGVLLYLVLLGTVGYRVVLNLRTCSDPLAIAALMLFLSWIVDTIGLNPSAYPQYQWFLWGMIGLSFRLRENEAYEARLDVRQTGEHIPPTRYQVAPTVSASLRPQTKFPLVSDLRGKRAEAR
ncbi:MAG: hypothetical protein GDA67_06110 [Nitrospira sp. CR1.3]|nr:hypothetical protein [Nitrospira sp. CR1.3]